MPKNQSATLTFSPPSWILSFEEFNASLRVVKELQLVGENHLKFGKLKSDMEQFLTNIQNRLETDTLFNAVMNESERDSVIAAVDEAHGWYESTRNRHVRLVEFAEKYRTLKASVYAPQIRAQLLEARQVAFKALNETLVRV
jgi:chromosome segregation and condensation protein ScpB